MILLLLSCVKSIPLWDGKPICPPQVRKIVPPSTIGPGGFTGGQLLESAIDRFASVEVRWKDHPPEPLRFEFSEPATTRVMGHCDAAYWATETWIDVRVPFTVESPSFRGTCEGELRSQPQLAAFISGQCELTPVGPTSLFHRGRRPTSLNLQTPGYRDGVDTRLTFPRSSARSS